jgi:hypothetical protein
MTDHFRPTHWQMNRWLRFMNERLKLCVPGEFEQHRLRSMIGENRQLATIEPVEFEKFPDEVETAGKSPIILDQPTDRWAVGSVSGMSSWSCVFRESSSNTGWEIQRYKSILPTIGAILWRSRCSTADYFGQTKENMLQPSPDSGGEWDPQDYRYYASLRLNS